MIYRVSIGESHGGTKTKGVSNLTSELVIWAAETASQLSYHHIMHLTLKKMISADMSRGG